MPSDTAYLDAVEKGDTQAAQRMVDEAAKAAGVVNVGKPLYHGGNKIKTSFAPGATRSGIGLAYLTDKKQVAWKYALGGGINQEMSLADYRRQQLKKLPSREPTVQKLYVVGDVADFSSYQDRPSASQLIEMFGERKMSNILEDYSSRYRDELDRGDSVESTLQGALEEGGFVREDTDATAGVPELQFLAASGLLDSYLKKIGKNVVAYDDVEAGGKTYVVFDPTKIKSAEPITRDDAGNVIPLSQRFKATSEDIRFMPDYSGEHRAPRRDSGAPMDNLKDVYPDDVYGPNAARYYGHESGSQTDKAAVRIIQATKGKPDALVKVFRAIPKSIQLNEINPGDWITTIKSYAVQHGEGPLGGDYKILEKTVPAGDLYTDGNSIFEFGYDPKFMPSPDSAMPGAYSFPGGYRAIPGKTKGSLRLYGPAGSLIGIASSLDEAQRILRRKAKQ